MNDLISRQETIRFLRDKVSLSTFMKRTVSNADKACIELCERIKNEVPPTQQWIPVSERPPKESDYIGCSECIDGAVWYYTDKGAMGLGYYYESTKAWATTDDTAPYGNVIAWMPLPEPYKGYKYEID